MTKAVAALAFALLVLLSAPGAEALDDRPRALAREAYIYAYAPIASYNTWYKQAVNRTAPEYVGGFNVFRHYDEPMTPIDPDAVAPDGAMLLSLATLDLRAEPMVLSVPEVPRGRYYAMQLVDLFTHNFAYVGTRETGNEAGSYMIVGPGWKGRKPLGIDQVLRSESDIVVLRGRTELKGPKDLPAAKALQAEYRLRPLSSFLNEAAPPPAPPLEFPAPEKAEEETHGFIGYLNFLLQFAEPTPRSELKLMQRFERIGIGAARPWDAAKVDPKLLPEIVLGVADAKTALKATSDETGSLSGLYGTRAFLMNGYMKRAVGAAKGLYGDSIEEAWHGGHEGDGREPSVIRFRRGELPPASYVWSVSLLTLPDRLPYANDRERYSLGERTEELVYDKEGSLTLYVGHDSPGKDKESNWLPAPAGPYSLVARLYGPQRAALAGKWTLPPLKPTTP